MSERDPARPVTVVNRFEVRGDIGTFEAAFRAHSQFLRHRPGFDFLVTMRLVDRPRVYVNLGHWKRLSGLLDTVHDDTFVAHVQRLAPMVRTEADQALSVSRVLSETAAVGESTIVLLSAQAYGNPAGFEERYAALGEACRATAGFGGSDLLRSTVRPLTYTGVLWWSDGDHCDRALAAGQWQSALDELSQSAEVVVERSRHLAYERGTRAAEG
ncbi:hypothetical protein [Streptomyces candidus]|uniref:Heme-degrading monooxygenase HmoA n=1 Tax=Streptomyces candidus TaxID=67283 RepID=A0A7X0HFS2_9ACTN|nr:hypothetical protein [Streptomyces candidus]MBB6436706.1 heme-degrading monooxygenase HmoA [Streptomyces candidus]GHH51143.1 hypothetical protein GCM10018773_49190 [Streptomyces candidus]